MKFICLLTLIVLLSSYARCQSNFSPTGFRQYQENVKNIGFEELSAKYDRKSVYYAERNYPSDISSFDYIDSVSQKLYLTGTERDLISKNNFVVSERLGSRSFAEAYGRIFNNDLPLFLSTDFFLHTLHSSYDEILKTLEFSILEPELAEFLEDLRSELNQFYIQNDPRDELLQSVKDIDLYLSMAVSLLREETNAPEFDDSGLYQDLMTDLEDPQGIKVVRLFSEHSRKLDISQFIPRGHYTDIIYTPEGERDLSAYFKAMMWLGRVDFMLTPPPTGPDEDPWSRDDMRRMGMDALLLNQLTLSSSKKENLERHDRIMSFFVGSPDNLTPDELSGISASLGIGVTSLLEDEIYDDFIVKLNESDEYGQKILSNFFLVDADTVNPATLPVSFRLLGQKFIIDSYVFSQVVYDRIQYENGKVLRMLPDPLDMMFVLGNEDALELLGDEVDTWHYGYKLAELRYLTDAFDDTFWSGSLYNTWLDAIRALNPAAKQDKTGFPYFMHTTQWQQEKLNTQLSSWTELRHDNILYAKQSYTGGTSCSFPHVFVEPYSGFYGKLADFASETAEYFRNELSGYMQSGPLAAVTGFFEKYGEHMKKLETIAEKELIQQKLSNDEIVFLKQFYNIEMICGAEISGWYRDLFFNALEPGGNDYLVVDVHTQPTDEGGNVVGKILHTGTGDINLGVFIAGAPDNNYRQTAFVGPVMSFHTRIEKDFRRLNDEEWEKLFGYGEYYDGRPDWVNSYLTGRDGRKRIEGRTLKGALYENNDTGPLLRPENIGYFIAWPNPATDHTTLHYFTNAGGRTRMEIFDLTGRKIKTLTDLEQPAGEYFCDFNTSGLADGIYLARLNTGVQSKVLRIIVGK